MNITLPLQSRCVLVPQPLSNESGIICTAHRLNGFVLTFPREECPLFFYRFGVAMDRLQIPRLSPELAEMMIAREVTR